jgi:hypothetical protein
MSDEGSAAAVVSWVSRRWPGAVFITWERHRRTRGLADRLGLQLCEFTCPGSRAQRYVGQIRETLRLFWNIRPRIVFVQNPSLVLAVLALLWRFVPGCPRMVIVDAHNEAVEPHVNDSRIIRAVAHWVLRRADFTLVSNRFLAEKVAALGGRPLVLPDPLPDIAPAPPAVLGDSEAIAAFVVATYAMDEPIGVILEAARDLVGLVNFQFSGDFRKLNPVPIAPVPPNVEFLGFLPEEEYWRRMQAAHVVLDLTLMDDCLVCGAYEAVALGRPIVLSDTRALKDYFRRGAIYCRSEPKELATALHHMRHDYRRLTTEIVALRSTIRAEWTAQMATARSAIDGASA